MKTFQFSSVPMTRSAALAHLAACEAAMLTAPDGEAMWFALKGKREALATLRGGKL